MDKEMEGLGGGPGGRRQRRGGKDDGKVPPRTPMASSRRGR